MDKYQVALQILAITTILITYYIILRILITRQKRKRLEPYSLNIDYNDDSLEGTSLKFINKLSNILNKLVIFNGISRTYDKYIYPNSRFKKGIDYISLKIILSLIITSIYIISTFLLKLNINIIVIISLIIISILIPDFYCYLKEQNNISLIKRQLLPSITLLNNNISSNKTILKSLQEVIKYSNNPISNEYKKVLSDYKIGLPLSEAFLHMYNRTNIKDIKMISAILETQNKTNNQKLNAFKIIEDNLLSKEKTNIKLHKYHRINNLISLIISIIPLIILAILIYTSTKLQTILLTKYSTLIIFIYSLIYIDYLLVIKMILGSDKYER